nr:T9SS type A sorting domain-containing protein [Candidatus Neomarinimicrobiota bacterium]
KSVLLSNGYFKLDIDNDLPFQITSLALVVMSGEETIWEVNVADIDPYTLYNSQYLFNESPITISMTEDISYTFNIAISPEQAGNLVDGNWSESCFPDLDSPPIYLCDDILTPIDASSTPSFPSVYLADNTCNGECGGECVPLYYCGTDGYVGISNLSCGEYPYLGDFTSSASPVLDPPIYAYINLTWDGSSLSQSGFAYPLDSTCDSQTFVNDGVCGSPIPTCTSGLVGMPCSQDTDCNTETECSIASGTEQYCSSTCDEGQYSDGWVYQAINPDTGDNGTLTISMEIMADEIGQVIVEIDAGIQDILNESIPSPSPIVLPGFNGFNIKGVKVDEATPEYPNELVMEMNSDFIVPIDFVINMDNFFENDTTALSESVEISGNSVTAISVADYLIANDPSESESFSEINISYDFTIEPGEYTIIPVDNKLNMGGISYSAEMSDLKLAYISSIADSLAFSPYAIPDMAGIDNPAILFTFNNQMGIPTVAAVKITGADEIYEFDILLNLPVSENGCNYDIGDGALTKLLINEETLTYSYYCGEDINNIIHSDTYLINSDDFLAVFNGNDVIIETGLWIYGQGQIYPATSCELDIEFGQNIGSGCTDPSACNYDINAMDDDGSCLELDCALECGGSAMEDCEGECNGMAIYYEECEACVGALGNMSCTEGCDGEWYYVHYIPPPYENNELPGTDGNGDCCFYEELDECGNCFGSGPEDNYDCAGNIICAEYVCLDNEACNYYHGHGGSIPPSDGNSICNDNSLCEYETCMGCDGELYFYEYDNPPEYDTCISDEYPLGVCDGNGWDYCDDDDNGTYNKDQYGSGAYALLVSDIPDDQGGYLYLSFNGSAYDTDSLSTEFTLPENEADYANYGSEFYAIERLDGGSWIALHSIAAYGAELYATEVRTLSDSTSISNALSEYRVIAAMTEGNYVSLSTAIGYSVDNIAPITPTSFTGSYDSDLGRAVLSWDVSDANDISHYNVYKNATLHTTVNDITFSEEVSEDAEYSVSAVDIHENESSLTATVSMTVLAIADHLTPSEFALLPAYPNPFNPVTTIQYSLPEYAKILIQVYDSNGGLVTELINASIQPGHYSVDWDATDYASGVYFVKMIAGDYMQNQKLMLVK